MRIAVLSGKGGTGKTLVSVNLASAALQAVFADCDVEEPNGHLFLKPEASEKTPVSVLVPVVDGEKCTRCRRCVDFCKYNALALVKDGVLVFNEVCHSCGGCAVLCPEGAITEAAREVGAVFDGYSGGVRVLTGRMNTGEVSGVPIIKELLARIPEGSDAVVDCPPGSACVVMESIRGADYCVLVAEPTLFGVFNLSMVHRLVALFEKPFGAVLNKCLPGENPAEEYCAEQGIKILAKIPYDEELGSLNSKGLVAVRESGRYRELFEGLLNTLREEAAQ